jgi:hypothetical protein
MPTRAVRAWLATPRPPRGAVPSRPTITESANRNSGSATSAPNAGTASRSISASCGFPGAGRSRRRRRGPAEGPGAGLGVRPGPEGEGSREGRAGEDRAGEGMACMLFATIVYLQTYCRYPSRGSVRAAIGAEARSGRKTAREAGWEPGTGGTGPRPRIATARSSRPAQHKHGRWPALAPGQKNVETNADRILDSRAVR